MQTIWGSPAANFYMEERVVGENGLPSWRKLCENKMTDNPITATEMNVYIGRFLAMKTGQLEGKIMFCFDC